MPPISDPNSLEHILHNKKPSQWEVLTLQLEKNLHTLEDPVQPKMDKNEITQKKNWCKMLVYRPSSIILLSSLLCIIVGDCIFWTSAFYEKICLYKHFFCCFTFVLLHLLSKQFRNTIIITSILWSEYWKILTATLWIEIDPVVFQYFVVLSGLIFSPLHFNACSVGKWYGIRKKIYQGQKHILEFITHLGNLRLCL